MIFADDRTGGDEKKDTGMVILACLLPYKAGQKSQIPRKTVPDEGFTGIS